MKFESLKSEEPALIRTLGLERELSGTQWNNRNSRPDGMTEEELCNLYFQQLEDDDVRGLFKIYEMDFELFGYTYVHGNQ